MRRLRALTACAGLVLLLPACKASLNVGGPPTGGPKCPTRIEPTPKGVDGPLLLTAQAVPSADVVPCLRALPAGWTFHELKAKKGKARIVLDFGRDGDRAATVTLTRGCDVRGATETFSDVPGVRRYERVQVSESSYRGDRFYVNSGGCITHHFVVHSSTGAAQVSALTTTLGFVERRVLRQYVHDYSDGRFELDPTAEAS
jgi:hypothetical protein